MSSKAKAHILVFLANFFFGTSVVAVKHLTPALMPPLALNVLRVSIALLLFWLLFLLDTNTTKNAAVKKKDIKLFFICALTGVALNQILFIKGVALTSAIHSSLLILCTPIVITVIAPFLIQEKITFNKMGGLVIGVAGAALLIFLRAKDDKESNTFGDFLVVCNAISYAFYLVLVKPLMHHYKPLHVTRWIFTIGAAFIIPIGFNDFLKINWNGFLWHHWLALCFSIIGATFLSYMFIVYGVSVLGASVTGTYIYTQPVFATVTSMLLFDEKLTVIKIISALLIFAGVFLVNLKRKDEA